MENVCGISLQNLDFNLVEATLLSFETKTLTPIIKEELKLKIQSQRLAAGKQELPKPVFKEPEKCQLTAEEEKKRDYRRERNRIAAAKCRNKRKSETENLKTVLAEEELKNYTLKRKLESLENEKQKLIKKLILQGHFTAQCTSDESPSMTSPVETTGLSGLPSPSPSPSVSSIEQYTTPASPVPRYSPLPLSFPSPVPPPPSPVPQLIFDVTPQPLKVSSLQSSLFQPVPSIPTLPLSLSVPSTSLVPSSLQPGLITFPSQLQLHEYDVNYEDLPSTSSGIYDYEKNQRRYSEDLPKNLGAQNYQPRRFSAESRLSDFEWKAKETAETFYLDSTSPQETNVYDENIVQTEQSINICQINNPNIIHDKDTDLSDEEFFRFENETLPFEKYQNFVQVTNSLSQVSSEDMVATDGIKPKMPIAKTFENFAEEPTTEKTDQEHMIETCLLQLIPEFEDEAMVPECDREDSFHVQTGPTSPTFY